MVKEGTAWPSMLVAALLLSWVGPAPCAGQSPTSTTNPATGAQRTASPAPSALNSREGGSGHELPPSTVSPAIGRFMRQGGRDLLPAPGTALATQGRREIPPPIPPPAPPAAVLRQEAQG